MSTVTATNPAATPIVNRLNELQRLEEEAIKLRQQIEADRLAALKDLPATLGYTDSAEFVRTLATVHNIRGFDPVVRRSSGRRVVHTMKRKARTAITPEMREKIKADFKSHKLSKEEIMAKWDISAPSAQNLKKEAGEIRGYKK